MTITVTHADGVRTKMIRHGESDSSTDITLFGKEFEGYPQPAAENLLRMLENFCSDTAPARPTRGQLWYKASENALYVCTSTSPSVTWEMAGGNARVFGSGATPPSTGVSEGQIILRNVGGDVNLSIRHDDTWKDIITGLNNSANDQTPTGTRVVRRNGTKGGANVVVDTLEFLIGGKVIAILSGTDFTPNASERNVHGQTGSDPLNPNFKDGIKRGFNICTDADFVINGTAQKALYAGADVAERYHADIPMEAGTLVRLGGDREITRTQEAYDAEVFGVVSRAPGVGLNEKAGNDDSHPYVALMGRVPVNVIGRVIKGNRMVSSMIPGHAQGALPDGVDWKHVFGRALESKMNEEPGQIEVAVGVK